MVLPTQRLRHSGLETNGLSNKPPLLDPTTTPLGTLSSPKSDTQTNLDIRRYRSKTALRRRKDAKRLVNICAWSHWFNLGSGTRNLPLWGATFVRRDPYLPPLYHSLPPAPLNNHEPVFVC